MTATQPFDFIIAGRVDAASYTLWDIAPAPINLTRRRVAVEELGVEAADAFGQVDIIQGVTAAQALDGFLDGLRYASGNPDYALHPNSNTSNLAVVAARANGAAKAGTVPVEAALTPGPDSFRITGWHSCDSEAYVRVRGAIEVSGFTFPSGMVSVQIDDHRNVSSTLDLVTACAILAAAGELDQDVLNRVVVLGELCGFRGNVRRLLGVTDAARAAHANRYSTVLAPADQVHDIRAMGLGLNVIAVRNLREAVAALEGLADQV